MRADPAFSKNCTAIRRRQQGGIERRALAFGKNHAIERQRSGIYQQHFMPVAARPPLVLPGPQETPIMTNQAPPLRPHQYAAERLTPEPRPSPPTGPSPGSCWECAYWVGPLDAPTGEEYGECRVRPPILGVPIPPELDANVLRAIWPWSRAKEWCGEFLRR